MHRTHYLLPGLVALLAFLLGCTAQECNAGPCLAATATTAAQSITATANPPTATAQPTATITPTSTPVNRDGLYDGSTNDGALLGAFQFVIENGKVTDILFNYTLRSGGCTFMSALSGTADKSAIEGNTVAATMYITNGNIFSLDGVFDSEKKAHGTLTYKGTLEGCGEVDKTADWTADRKPIPPTQTPTPIPPTETATPLPTATQTPPPTFFEKPITPVIPPEATAVPTVNFGALPPDLEPLADAINKTLGMTTYRLDQSVTLTGTLASSIGPEAANGLWYREQTEINRPNRHTILYGTPAQLWGADPDKGLEYILLDGKAYVHGPAKDLGAPQDKWYTLDNPSLSSALDNNPLAFIELLTQDAANLAKFELADKNTIHDGQVCSTYAGGPNAFENIAAALANDSQAWSMDDGKISIVTCGDGYLHSLEAHLAFHDKQDAAQTAVLDVMLHLFDMNNISIRVPRELVTTDGDATPRPTESRTPVTNTTAPEPYDTEFPLPDDVRNFDAGGFYEGQINYQTKLSLTEIVDFYRRTLSERDVREDTRLITIDDKGFSIVFTGWKPNMWLVIQGVDLGDLRNVNLRLEKAR